MSPEMTTAATPQLVNMPRINSPFAAYNQQQAQQQVALANHAHIMQGFVNPAKVFPSTHMPSPWTTAQFLQSQSLQQGQCMQGLMPQPCMHTGLQQGGFAQPNITNNALNPGWGQSTMPPIDIQVLNDQEAVTNKQNVKENTKVSWTSAEQLADAIFPSSGAREAQTQDMHDGLLNHKTAIEALYAENNRLHTQHDGLLNHKTAIEALQAHSNDLQKRLRRQNAHTSTHEVLHSATAAKVSTLKQAVQDVSSNHTTLNSATNKLSTSMNAHASTLKSLKTQQDAHSDGLINHRDVLRKCVRDISELQTSIKNQEKADNTLSHTSWSERTSALEHEVQKLVASNMQLRASNNIINDHIGELKTKADSALDRNEVQMILAPRRKI